MRLELIEFENTEKFYNAIAKVLNGEEGFRSYTDKEGKVQRQKIISNNRLFIGNELSLRMQPNSDTGKIYLSVDYFGVDDRIQVNKNKQSNSKVETTDV